MSLIQVTSGGQRSLLKKKLQVCESQQSCLFVGDQILIFHHNLQINSLKILQCDFLDFFSYFVSHSWLQASLIFLSGRTCTIGGWLNTFLPHCIYTLYNFLFLLHAKHYFFRLLVQSVCTFVMFSLYKYLCWADTVMKSWVLFLLLKDIKFVAAQLLVSSSWHWWFL